LRQLVPRNALPLLHLLLIVDGSALQPGTNAGRKHHYTQGAVRLTRRATHGS
jgi:hypothetical protein